MKCLLYPYSYPDCSLTSIPFGANIHWFNPEINFIVGFYYQSTLCCVLFLFVCFIICGEIKYPVYLGQFWFTSIVWMYSQCTHYFSKIQVWSLNYGYQKLLIIWPISLAWAFPCSICHVTIKFLCVTNSFSWMGLINSRVLMHISM